MLLARVIGDYRDQEGKSVPTITSVVIDGNTETILTPSSSLMCLSEGQFVF